MNMESVALAIFSAGSINRSVVENDLCRIFFCNTGEDIRPMLSVAQTAHLNRSAEDANCV